ncbi:MAG: T9SS type B sorting domain-containing protein [Pedobacter sp.]|nr:MAG: T9SS type B sorting domain-containing protein [Pedobacter sp.]
MTNRKTGFVLAMLLFFAATCFSQSAAQSVTVPYGASLMLRASSVRAVKYQWIRNGAAISGATMPDYKVQINGDYSVISISADGCSSAESGITKVIYDVQPVVQADVMIAKVSEIKSVTTNQPFDYTLKVTNNGAGSATLVKVQDVLPEKLQFVSLGTPTLGIANYNSLEKSVLWELDKMDNGQIAELKLSVKSLSPGSVSNTATVSAHEADPNGANNQSTDVKIIIGVLIPNVFTPNDDGTNDNFEIQGIENYPDNELVILNRWQATIYQKKGYLNDWKGDGLNEGTYFYLLKINIPGEGQKIFKGYITLIRNKSK